MAKKQSNSIYNGLTAAEARELYESLYKDYLDKKKAKDVKEFQDKVGSKQTEFAQKYITPVVKTAASVTPAGPAIGLTDAYWALQSGDKIGAALMAGAEALPYGLKYAGKGIKGGFNILDENKQLLKQIYYNKAPWTWKPNPNNYYRAGQGIEFLDDVKKTNKIRAISDDTPLITDGPISLRRKTFPEADTYWSKGAPLDNIYGPQNYGNYVIEASNDIPFIHAVNQKTRQSGFWNNPDINYNPTHKKYTYVKPRQSYDYDELGNITPSKGTPLDYNKKDFKLLKPHWFKGYTEYKNGGNMNKLSKQINNQFIPTYTNGYPVFMYGGSPKQYALGSWIKNKALPLIGDGAKLYADNMLSVVGASDVIKDDAYKNKAFKDISGVTSGLFGAAGQIGANLIAPGAGGALMGSVQQGVGELTAPQVNELKIQSVSNLPAQPSYVPTFADGGEIRDFLHKKVGIPLALNQFGYDLIGGNAPITEKSLSLKELETLRQAVRTNLSKGKNYIGYGDYATSFSEDEKLMYNAYEGGIKDNLKALSSPAHNLQKMLGQAKINVAGNDTTVVDNYDFNLRNTPKQFFTDLLKGNYNSPYQALENFGHTFGSKEGEGSPVKINISQKASGGSIHIKPSKRGTFKAQATKMGMGVQEAASKILNAPEDEYSPTMRKKANFAKNFAKADGGELQPYITSNPNDPRIQTYQDSLLVHNTYKNWVDYMNNPDTSADDFEEFISTKDNYKKNGEGIWKSHNVESSYADDQDAEDAIKRLKKINEGVYSPKKFTTRDWGTTLNMITAGLFGEGRMGILPVYEKPKQEVIYQPEAKQSKTITRKPINISEINSIQPNLYNKPNSKNLVKEDLSKYNDLRMQSLWANITKENPEAIIGTLYNKAGDPDFKKGFNLQEALKFPKEIRDKYNIDYVAKRVFESGGGLSRSKDYGSKKNSYPSIKSGDFAGGHRLYPIPTKADAVDALRLAGLHGRGDIKAKMYKKSPELKKAGGGAFHVDGGMLNSYDSNMFLPISDRLTEIKSGSTHEQSPYNGVPITNNALVENDEYIFTTKGGKKYVFSNRLTM